MKEQTRIGKNITIVLIGDIVTNCTNLVFFAYAARYFGSLNFGVLSFAIAINSLLTILIDFGINPLLIREVARDKSVISIVFITSFIIKSAFGIVALIILSLYLKLFQYEANVIIVTYIMFLFAFINSIKTMLDSVFQGLEKPKYSSITKVLSSVLLLFSLYVAMVLEWNLIYFSAVYPVIAIINILFFAYSVRQNVWINRGLNFNFDYIQYIMKESWPFMITSLFISLYVYTDSIMLSMFKGETEVGYYSIAYKLVLALLFIPIAFNVCLYPFLSKHYILKSKDTIKYATSKYFSIMMYLGMPIGVGTTLLAHKIINLIFGSEYLPSVIVLQILIWSLVFTYMNAPFIKLFESINMATMVTRITCISALINIMINYLLIPKYSMVGASIATVITEFIVATLLMVYATKLGYFSFEYSRMSKVILSCMFMGLFIYITDNWNIGIVILCSSLIYGILLYLFKEIDQNTVRLLKSLIPRV